MRPGFKPTYTDSLAKKRRQARIAKISVFSAVILAILAGIIYLLFFTPWLEIQAVTIEADERRVESIETETNKYLNSKWLGLVPVRRNILFMSSSSLREHLLNSFDGIKTISIDKDYPHSLNISSENRQAVMIWCFSGGCRYVDSDGLIWGQSPESSGFIIPVVKDYKDSRGDNIDVELFNTISGLYSSLNELKIPIQSISIKEGAFEELVALTSDEWPIYMTFEFPVSDQIKTLSIFLNEKKNEKLVPEYIDLRISGRVYYKSRI